MSALLHLSSLAVRGLVFGACQAIGLEAGDRAFEPVSRFLNDRFAQQGPRLLRALEKANARAWDVLEIALAGESLWQRCVSLFTSGEDNAFRAEVKSFLAAMPVVAFVEADDEFRRLALKELRLARREGALRVSSLDVTQLAHHAGRFAGYCTPEALIAAEQQALAAIADCFPGDRYANLRRFLQLAAPGDPPLLTAAARYFLRREVEADRELFQGLSFGLLEQQPAALESGFRQVEALLDRYAGRLETLVNESLHLTSHTHDEVMQISAKLDELLRHHHLAGRELRLDDTFLSLRDDERQLIRELIRHFRALPEAEKAGRQELLFKVAQAEALTGDFAEAQQTFAVAARLADEPAARADAHASAFQVALARRDYPTALDSLLDAARIDPARFAPFPLDKYVPQRLLGAGSNGCVYLCRHAFQGSLVVVKALWGADLGRPIDAVFNEAQALTGLHHPGIVPVLDCDFADRTRRQRPFLVLEPFDGVALAAHVAEHGPLSPEGFLPLARQVAAALQATHEKGILHRDVKPGNVLINLDAGQVRLIDFGLALRPATLAATHVWGDHTRSSAVGASIAGTWKYAAPEQLGELPDVPVGPYSDVHAFGRTCYFALLGSPEPDDDDKAQLPEAWRALLSRCTARKPGRRPQSFGEVLAELDGLGPRPVTPAVETPRRVRAECVQSIAAHEGTVSVVTYRGDGKLLATAGFDDRIRLWSLPSGLLLEQLKGHAADVNGLAFHPNGALLASAGDDRELRLWEVPRGTLLGARQHPDRVYAVAFSPDGQLLATGCDDGKVRLWSLRPAPTLAGTLAGHASFVRQVAFSPDGALLASASGDKLVHLWDPRDGKRRLPLVGHTHTVWGVAFSPDGRLVVSASQDRTARIWNVADGKCLFSLEGHQDLVWTAAFSGDGRLVATASHDRTVKLWSAATGQLLATLDGHTALVRSLAFAPDGTTLATASGDGSVKQWRVSASEPPETTLPPRPVVTLAASGRGMVYPGDELSLQIEVENRGRGDLLDLRGHCESASPLLRPVTAVFERVRPGEKLRRVARLRIPADQPRGELQGRLVFHEAHEYQPPPVAVVVKVGSYPRHDVLLKWRLVDDGTGNSFGDGDGRPNRGECIDVLATVENQSPEALEGLQLVLVAQEVPTGVVVHIPRSELPAVPVGGAVEGRVTFSVKPLAALGPARFELRVEAADGRLIAQGRIETRIE